ncbi:MAG: ABC-F family ATP-binding cassette domain-containing protein [bacterium]|nr:ABC-F family ATP-binding cassette domain-containing protein [bacterium]
MPVSRTAVGLPPPSLYTDRSDAAAYRQLSGGERSRLQLARLVLEKPNLLILDEPTNNLDIHSIEVLEETLEEFVGTVLVISHDRYFLDKWWTGWWSCVTALLTEFIGGYTDYLAETADAG